MATLLGGSLPAVVLAQEAAVVTGSELRPYQEAVQGFQAGFGRPVAQLKAGSGLRLPPDARVVVAFGGKAALARYPDAVGLVYCMAPGTRIGPVRNGGLRVKVRMHPHPRDLLRRLREIQPGMKTLVMLWVSEDYASIADGLREAAEPSDLRIVSERLSGPDDLPEALRRMRAKADAIWLPLDPRLLNEDNLDLLKEFSWANGIPFYTASADLLERGAAASVGFSFHDIGHAAAQTALKILSKEAVGPDVFPDRIQVGINEAAASKVGLRIPAEALKGADRLLP